jgi:hypothetical protein
MRKSLLCLLAVLIAAVGFSLVARAVRSATPPVVCAMGGCPVGVDCTEPQHCPGCVCDEETSQCRMPRPGDAW